MTWKLVKENEQFYECSINKHDLNYQLGIREIRTCGIVRHDRYIKITEGSNECKCICPKIWILIQTSTVYKSDFSQIK